MDQQDILSEIEARAKRLRIPMYKLCEKAEVNKGTVSRWKTTARNPHPSNANLATIKKLTDKLDEMESIARRILQLGEQ